MCYTAAVTPSLPSLLHQPPLCNLRASKLLIVLPHINSKSLIFMSHPTLPLDRIPAVCYLFPLPPLFSVYLHTTGAAVFWSVPNDNDCCKIRVIFRTLCTGEAFHCTQNWFPFNSDTVFNDIQYRRGNILLVSTGLLDDFLMTINIDSELSSYSASRATEATTKPDCSLFLHMHICTRVALLSPSFSISVLFNFICKTDVFRPSRPGTRKQAEITSCLNPWKRHIC